jgi:hypothetical protein
MDKKIKNMSKNLRYVGLTHANSPPSIKEHSVRVNSRGAGSAYDQALIPSHIMETKAILPKRRG